MKTTAAIALLISIASSASAQSAKNGFEIRTASTRADLISGGDVLVQVTVPATVAAEKLAVSVNGRDVSGDFKLASHANTFIGLVKDLPIGRSEVAASGTTSLTHHTAIQSARPNTRAPAASSPDGASASASIATALRAEAARPDDATISIVPG